MFMKERLTLGMVTATALLLAACGGPNTFPEVSDNRVSSETALSEVTLSSNEQADASSTMEFEDGASALSSDHVVQQTKKEQEAMAASKTSATAATVPSSAVSASTSSKTPEAVRPTTLPPMATTVLPSSAILPSQPQPTTTRQHSAAPTAAATATKPTTVPTPGDKAEQVTALVNAERAKAGLSPLTLDQELSANAAVRAEEIVHAFSHTRPNGSAFSSAITISYRRAGENIAYGYPTAKAVMDGWMNSSGHRANILQSSFTKIGVGVVQRDNTLYWVQLFTG